MALTPGTRIGPYEVTGVLGAGGSARGQASERSESSLVGAGVGPRATRTKKTPSPCR